MTPQAHKAMRDWMLAIDGGRETDAGHTIQELVNLLGLPQPQLYRLIKNFAALEKPLAKRIGRRKDTRAAAYQLDPVLLKTLKKSN